MIPLISSGNFGPAGVCQLPRLWWKVVLKQAGQLDADYPDCSGGLDSMVLEQLDLDKEPTLNYIRRELPTYLEFENWVLEQKGGSLDRQVVEQWNKFIRERIHKEEKLVEIHAALGLANDGKIQSALLLNHLEDWHYFQQRDLAGGLPGKAVPLIATIDAGPLGVSQLPRTWLKVLLEAKGLLHPDYPACGGGLDSRVLEVLGLDKEETLSYLRGRRPSYLEFEGWVLAQTGGSLDLAAVGDWNQYLLERLHNEEKRMDIHATLGFEDEGSIKLAMILNQLEDWHLAHAQLLG